MYSLLAIAFLYGILQGAIGYPQPDTSQSYLDARLKRAVPASSYFRKGEGVKVDIPGLETTTDIITTTYPPGDEGLNEKKKTDTFNKNQISGLNSEKGGEAQKTKPTPEEKKSEKKPNTTSVAPETKLTSGSHKEVSETNNSPTPKESSGFGILPDVFGIKPKLQKLPNLFGR